MGKGIGESVVCWGVGVRGESVYLRVEEVIVILGNFLFWWNSYVIFIKKYFLGRLKWLLLFLEIDY